MNALQLKGQLRAAVQAGTMSPEDAASEFSGVGPTLEAWKDATCGASYLDALGNVTGYDNCRGDYASILADFRAVAASAPRNTNYGYDKPAPTLAQLEAAQTPAPPIVRREAARITGEIGTRKPPMILPSMETAKMPTSAPIIMPGMVQGPNNSLIGAITGAIGGLATGGPVGGILGGLGGLLGVGGGGGGGTQTLAPQSCAPGYVFKDGRCQTQGITGTIQRVLPGGQTGTQADAYGQAVMGRYGAALVPAQVTQLVNRCPRGTVLGDDGLCYDKRDVRKNQRKWNPGRKPLFTGGDLNAISKAARLEHRAKKIAQDLGFHVETKAAAAARRAKSSKKRR